MESLDISPTSRVSGTSSDLKFHGPKLPNIQKTNKNSNIYFSNTARSSFFVSEIVRKKNINILWPKGLQRCLENNVIVQKSLGREAQRSILRRLERC